MTDKNAREIFVESMSSIERAQRLVSDSQEYDREDRTAMHNEARAKSEAARKGIEDIGYDFLKEIDSRWADSNLAELKETEEGMDALKGAFGGYQKRNSEQSSNELYERSESILGENVSVLEKVANGLEGTARSNKHVAEAIKPYEEFREQYLNIMKAEELMRSAEKGELDERDRRALSGVAGFKAAERIKNNLKTKGWSEKSQDLGAQLEMSAYQAGHATDKELISGAEDTLDRAREDIGDYDTKLKSYVSRAVKTLARGEREGAEVAREIVYRSLKNQE